MERAVAFSGFSFARLRRSMAARTREEDHHGCAQIESEEVEGVEVQEKGQESRAAKEDGREEVLKEDCKESRAESCTQKGEEDRERRRQKDGQEVCAEKEISTEEAGRAAQHRACGI